MFAWNLILSFIALIPWAIIYLRGTYLLTGIYIEYCIYLDNIYLIRIVQILIGFKIKRLFKVSECDACLNYKRWCPVPKQRSIMNSTHF